MEKNRPQSQLSRRLFLKGAAIASVSFGISPRFLPRALAAPANGKRVLVCIFQRGAVDGLNMVVPYRESRYYDLRPNIAIPAPGATGGGIDLDGEFALHPALAPLKPFFDAGELAAVQACGSPDSSRSHFDAQDYMETGTPGDKSTRDGWLNRHLQEFPLPDTSVYRAVALQGAMPVILSGEATTLAISSLPGLQIGRGGTADVARSVIEQMYAVRQDLIGGAVRNAVDAIDAAEQAKNLPADNGAVYPTTDLGPKLRDIARLIKADVGLEVAFADVGGWDTHALQGASDGQLSIRLDNLARSLEAFRVDLGERFGEVCVVTMSEFGRTLKENGTIGTDHGHATAMLVHGGSVRGGQVYGSWPGLDDADLFEGRDLQVTTDFRTLFGELVERHLGNDDIASVFPGFDYDSTAKLGVIS